MGEQHTSKIERLLHRIEDYVEEWRRQNMVHKAEVMADRERM